MKTLIVLIDGLGDTRIIKEKTPLQAAKTPQLDMLAKCGLNGLVDPVEPGLACGSDTAHMNIFGYSPRRFYRGRGAFESLGAGLDVQVGDIAFKSNFATVEGSLVRSRRADRDFEQEGPLLCEYLNGMTIPGFEAYKVHVKYATEHRCGVCVSGPGLSDQVTGTDPLKDNLPLLECKPKDDSQEAKFTSDLVNALSREIHRKLKKHPLNAERKAAGKNEANIVLLRGCGTRLALPSIYEKHSFLFPKETDAAFAIAPTCMIAGWMETIGIWCVKEGLERATGDYHTDIELKGRCGSSLLRKRVETSGQESWFKQTEGKQFTFGFVHIKAVDDAGHDGRLDLKVNFLERIDRMLSVLVEELRLDHLETGEEYLIIVTGDHTTPVAYGDHSCEPVPFVMCPVKSLIYPNGELQDIVESFSETAAAQGILGRFPGSEIFPLIVRVGQATMRKKHLSHTNLAHNESEGS